MGLFDQNTAPGTIGMGSVTTGGPEVESNIAGPSGVEGGLSPMMDTPGAGAGIGKAAGAFGGAELGEMRSKNQKNFDTIFGHAQDQLKQTPVMPGAPRAQAAPQIQVSPPMAPPPMLSAPQVPQAPPLQPPPMMSDMRTKTGIRSGARDLRGFLDAIRRANGV